MDPAGGHTDWLFVRAGHGAIGLLSRPPFANGQIDHPEHMHPRTRVTLVGGDEVSLEAVRRLRPSAVDRICQRTTRFRLPILCNATWVPQLFHHHNPSTGLVALAYLRHHFQGSTFVLFGWTFHRDLRQTYTTHNFAEEEKLVARWDNVWMV